MSRKKATKIQPPYEHELGDLVFDVSLDALRIGDDEEELIEPVGIVRDKMLGGASPGGVIYLVHFPDGGEGDLPVTYEWHEIVPEDLRKRAKWERAKAAHAPYLQPIIQPLQPFQPIQPIMPIAPQPYTPVVPWDGSGPIIGGGSGVWGTTSDQFTIKQCAIEQFHMDNPGQICLMTCSCPKCSVWCTTASTTVLCGSIADITTSVVQIESDAFAELESNGMLSNTFGLGGTLLTA